MITERETPRTDKLKSRGIEWVPIGRMATLERDMEHELSEAREKLKAAVEALERISSEDMGISSVIADNCLHKLKAGKGDG